MKYISSSSFITDVYSKNVNNGFKTRKTDSKPTQRNVSPHHCQQSSNSHGETMVLKEVREMKKLLSQIVSKNSGNSTVQNRNGAILQHIQDNVRKLMEQSCEMSPEEVMKLLNSVSTNITKLQSPNPDADNINTAINNLKKHIKWLKPEAEITGCDLETQMKSILTILHDIMKRAPPESERLDKIAKNLRAICCNLKRQCSKGNKILLEIREFQELFSRGEESKRHSFLEFTNRTSSFNKNWNNVSAQYLVELLETSDIKKLMAQIVDELECLQSENNFEDYCLDHKISRLMKKIQQSGCVKGNFAEKFSEMKKLECEALKQRLCESDSTAKLHEISGDLKSDSYQASVAETINETPELITRPIQLRYSTGHVQPEDKLSKLDILYILKYIQGIIQANNRDFVNKGALSSLLTRLKHEIYKPKGSTPKMIHQLNTHLETAYASSQNRSSQPRVLQVNTNQSSDVEIETLNETQHLKCLVHHLKKFIKKYDSSSQFPEGDFSTLMNFILDTVMSTTGSNAIDGESKEQLLKIMRCLEAEFRQQGELKNLNKKVAQIRDNLADKVYTEAKECGGSSIDPAELIRCLVHHLKKIVLKAIPSVQIQEGDQETQLLYLLGLLKDTLQSNGIDQEAQGKLSKMMRCLKFSLSKLEKLTPTLAAKIQDINESLDQGELKMTSNLVCLANQLRDILQNLMPNASIPDCTSEAVLDTLLDLLIQALRSGISEDKKGTIKSILTGLQTEVARQISTLSSLQTKINTAIGMLKSEGPSLRCSECPAKLAETPDLIAITSLIQRLLQRAKPNLQFPSSNILSALNSSLDNLLEVSGTSCTAEIADTLSCLLPALNKILCKQGQCELREKVKKLIQTQCRRSDCSLQDPLRGSQLGPLMSQLNDLVLLIYPDLISPNCNTELKAKFFAAALKELAQRGSFDTDNTMQIKPLIFNIVKALQTFGADKELIQDFQELEAMFSSQLASTSQLAGESDILNLRDIISRNINTMNDCIQQLENAMQKYGLD
ncbi:hypothetical protein Aperf_G00000106611 [Anoplocephala perfoliata]